MEKLKELANLLPEYGVRIYPPTRKGNNWKISSAAGLQVGKSLEEAIEKSLKIAKSE